MEDFLIHNYDIVQLVKAWLVFIDMIVTCDLTYSLLLGSNTKWEEIKIKTMLRCSCNLHYQNASGYINIFCFSFWKEIKIITCTIFFIIKTLVLTFFYIDVLCSEEILISSMPYPAVFLHLIPALIGILGANVQGTTKPLFETHLQNMWASLIAIVLYCFALPAYMESRLRRANSFPLSGVMAITSGSLASVSLVSTFLPRTIGHIILYVAWLCGISWVIMYQYGRCFIDACRWLYHEILNPFFSSIRNWFQG